MAYTRGSREDYDRWAEVTGDDGWSWDNLVHYMEKVSNPESLSFEILDVMLNHRTNASVHHQTITTPQDSSTPTFMGLTVSTLYRLKASPPR
jgi:choline dehydrogenase-like flavoprotein